MFDFRLFAKVYFKSIFAYHETGNRHSARHTVFLIVFPLLFLLLQVINRIGFLIDAVFYRDFRRIDVRKPLFIIGFPRSGTTHLQRLFVKDEEQFTALKLWEIQFAPSITQKKFFRFIGRLDRKRGSPWYRRVLAWEDRVFEEAHKMHPISLFAPEEDEIILAHIFSSAFLSFMFPFEEMRRFVHFDTALSEKKRRRIMRFYKNCVKRHLYVFGKDKIFVSKNPAFSAKIHSLYDTFADARIIYMVRTPFEAVPSAISWMSTNFKTFHTIENRYETERIIDWISHWYTEPVEILSRYPKDIWTIETYNELVTDAAGFMTRVCERLGYPVSENFRAILDAENRRAKSYQSRHRYNLADMGLNAEKILSTYAPVFKRFGFSAPESEDMDIPAA